MVATAFAEIRSSALRRWERFDAVARPRILVGAGTCGQAAGASEIIETIRSRLKRRKFRADIHEVGCLGMCYAEVLVEVAKPGGPRILYGNLSPENVSRFVTDCILGNRTRRDLALATTGEQGVDGLPRFEELPMIRGQARTALRNCGWIDPGQIDHYIARGGYAGLARALTMEPGAVIGEIKHSGLRGRGGAGFPTGLKWEFCARAQGSPKYLVCNADEGDPGAFMDRSVLESDPHAVLEGMVLAAYAIGASKGYVYVRAEYPLAIRRLEHAIKAMRGYGLLGSDILGSGFSFDVAIKEGAGAFVCGEETALIGSIEGRRGMPNARPPFPAVSGLFGKPTNINNVETLANVSAIMAMGAGSYAALGTEKSKGTKTFALAGKICRTGLIEVPLGTTLRQIIYDIGGGIPDGKRLKAVQTGGPSGGCLPPDKIDLPVDYETLAAAGSIMGSGGMVVMDEETCMVDIARYFVEFTRAESCGKCIPCRVGTAEMLNILNRITTGAGTPEDIDLLVEIGNGVRAAALCGLGQTAPNPVLTTLRYFRHEYEEHVLEHKCRAVVCRGLVTAPCSHTCPAGIDVPRYVRCVGSGRYREALNVIRERIPFPSVCGRVCFHPCETKCRRGQIDEPIAIRALKRVATDRGGPVPRVTPAGSNGKRVAIVGSGPCGLTAGYYLRILGYSVEVFEAHARPGGMMWSCIPDYRLPPKVLRREIDSLGLTIHLNTRVRSLGTLRKRHDAVVVATGAHEGVALGIPGENSANVIDCTDFLRKVNGGERFKVGTSAIVIGGGNAAIDAARVALRQGAAHVSIVYRRDAEQMPATSDEVEEARRERVRFEFLAAPVRIRRTKEGLRVTFNRMRLGPVDSSGRPSPRPVHGDTFDMDADTIIAAIGQKPTTPKGLASLTDRRGRVGVTARTCMTQLAGVFAGGDVVLGPSSVIESIAQGRAIAQSVDRYCGGTGNIEQVFASAENKETLTAVEPEGTAPRVRIPTIPLKERTPKREVELCLSPRAARREARRCLNCDLEE
jgi:NADH-quinone oxidoreductase subunit F